MCVCVCARARAHVCGEILVFCRRKFVASKVLCLVTSVERYAVVELVTPLPEYFMSGTERYF